MSDETVFERELRIKKARKRAKDINTKYNAPVQALLESMGVACSVVSIGSEYNPWGSKAAVVGRNSVYHVTFSRGTKKFIVPKFYQSAASSELNIPPTEYDVLACVQKYDVGSFADFCSEFGYDQDSRKALDIYLAVQAEFNGVIRFFTQSEIEQISEIAQ